MNWFGITLVVLYILSVCLNFYHAGNGGSTTSEGEHLLAGILGLVILGLLIFVGIGY